MSGRIRRPADTAATTERRGNLVVTKGGIDFTEKFRDGAEQALELAKQKGCKLAILKARSPSCGNGCIYSGNFNGTTVYGNGVTTELLIKHGVAVISEEDLPWSK